MSKSTRHTWRFLCVFLAAAMLSGCNLESGDRGSSMLYESEPEYSEVTTTPPPQSIFTPEKTTVLAPDDVIPAAAQVERAEGERLSYTIEEIHAEGKSYSITVSGVYLGEPDGTEKNLDRAVINGKLYGDFRLDLLLDGKNVSSLSINVPRDDRFLLLESADNGLDYGYTNFSSLVEYGDGSVPDLFMLDFMITARLDVPQYARVFAIENDTLYEVPFYSGGVEVAPYGTHLTPIAAGVVYNRLVVDYGNYKFGVVKNYYTFDKVNKRLVRTSYDPT